MDGSEILGIGAAEWARFAGRLHPALVHFPVALLLVAAAAEIAGAVRRATRPSRLALQCLAIGAAAAVIAAACGWIGADAEPPPASQATILFIHRWSGVVAAGLACLTLGLGLGARRAATGRPRNAYRATLLVTATLIATGGFFGGEIVHGRGHLLAALRPPPPAPPPAVATPATGPRPAGATAAAPIDFDRDVLPILQMRCVECHGPSRSRGGLRVDTRVALLDGDAVLPGDAPASPLVQRVSLPAEHPDRMPAEGPPLAAAEIAMLAAWVDGLETTDAHATRDEPKPAATPDRPRVGEGARRVIATLRARGAAAGPESASGDAVEVNFAVAEPPATDDDLALLAGLEDALVRLNLSRSAVTDAGIGRLAAFGRLRVLRLDHCAIGDDAVAALAGLAGLERVNLYNSAFTDAGLEDLRAARPDLDIVAPAPLPSPLPER